MNWQHTQGPEGGGVAPIYNNDSFAFYTDEFYLYRSADGIQWEQLPYGNLWPMAVSNDKLAALQGVGFGNYPNNRRFIVSYDQGVTWLEGTLPPTPTGGFTDMAVCSHGIYVPYGQGGYIFRSQDDGLTWDTIAPPGQYCYDIWAFEDRVYVQWGSRFYRLAVNGVDWELVSPGFSSGDHPFSMYISGNVRLFACENSLWSSQNNGQSWSKYNLPIHHNSLDRFVAVGSRIYKRGGNTRLLYTDDLGKTWKEAGFSYANITLDLATIGGRLLCSTYRHGVLHLNETTNTFEPAYQGLFSAAAYNLEAAGNYLWAGCGNGVFAYNLTNAVWENKAPLPLSNFYYNKVAVSPAGVIAVREAAYTNRIYLSNDTGNSWDTLYPYNPDWAYFTNLYWLGETLVFKGDFGQDVRTPDYGATWIQGPMPELAEFFNGKHYGLRYGKLVSSTNLGATWDAETTPVAGGYIRFVAFTPDRMFVWGSDSLGNLPMFMTADGLQWQYGGDGLPVDFVPDLEEDRHLVKMFKTGGKYYFFSPKIGLFASLDTCQTWLPVEYNRLITCADSTFFTGGFGGGVRKSAPPDIFGSLSSGIVFSDDNNNGQQDVGEAPMPGVQVTMLEPGAWYPYWFVQTRNDGSYTLGSTPGADDTLRVRVFSKYVEQINPPYYAVSSNANNRHFGVHFKQNITDLSVRLHAAGRPRPGFDLTTYVRVNNLGTVASDGVLSVMLDPQYQFTNATPPPTAVLGDSLVWQIAQLPVFQDDHITIRGVMNVQAPLGEPFKIAARITPGQTDYQLSDNEFLYCDTIVGSFDPNEKRVEPAEGLLAEEILAGKELYFTVHFQNTGTYQAERVRITDQLDTALNATTLRLVSASHDVTSFRLLPGNLLEVVFDQIFLPDSTSDEPGSHGFVTFAVQRNKVFRPQYVVRNKASIYFDFNDPIITNTVTSKVIPVSVSTETPPVVPPETSLLIVSPNPNSGDGFRVEPRTELFGSGELSVWSVSGVLQFRTTVTDLAKPVVVDGLALSKGAYWVVLTGEHGRIVGKMTVQ